MVRLRVIKRALLGLPAHAAADMLKLSIREVFRLKARVRARGDSGIVHDNRGRQRERRPRFGELVFIDGSP
ncbi:MAG: hypothetical protein R6X14_02835, partial [bacterium]